MSAFNDEPRRMSPPSPRTDIESEAESQRIDVGLRRHSWEAYSVIVATIVGLLSLSVSAYTAYTLHVQTRAQVFPYLQLVNLGEAHRVGVYNKGVGPAFVKSVKVEVEGKPVTTWRQFFAATGIKLNGSFAYSNVNHVPIAANETLAALVFTDVADFKAYQAIDFARVKVDVCYCSVLDECRALRVAVDSNPEPKEISSCKVDPATDFTQ
jgi:hypothetical protein